MNESVVKGQAAAATLLLNRYLSLAHDARCPICKDQRARARQSAGNVDGYQSSDTPAVMHARQTPLGM
jgi:hypothetical protein